MIQCPGCGGALKFDVYTQKLKCESCSSSYEPYSFDNAGGAEESTEYDVTIYRCPQCGGEICSTDEAVAAFCSYCGSSNILESRLTKEKRPELIIPFKRSKKECEDSFSRFIKRAIFAPKSYREAGKADSFRGIYMPYWLYDMSQNGNVSVKTSTSHRSGDYIITDHYLCSGRMDSYYNGVSYDASSSFADDISASIAPYNVKDITRFSPAFLSGYYADVADVSSATYRDTAVELAQESSYNYIRKKSPMSSNSFDESKETVKSKIDTRINVIRSAMFPVWFMSYRNKDRVAYATVNGQTGKVSADIPMSVPKFLLCSLILSGIIFALLQLFLTVTPNILVILVAILGFVGVLMYNSEIKKIIAKENYDDDLGMLSVIDEKKRSRMQAQKGASFENSDGTYVLTQNDIRRAKKQEARQRKAQKKGNGTALGVILTVFIICMFAPGLFSMLAATVSSLNMPVIGGAVGLILLVITIILTISISKEIKYTQSKNGLPATLWTTISLGVITVVSVLNPVSDAIYYGAAIVAMVGVILNLIDLMRCHNLLAMRPLPQFEKYQGGDDRA